MKNVCLAFLFILVSCTFVYADIYRYVDENGVICYTDTPFNKKANRIMKEKGYSSSASRPESRLSREDPSIYSDIIHEKATAYDLDPTLIKAVIKAESNWNSRAVSRKGAMGLMQLMPATANEMNVSNPFDPEDNIEGGTKYLKYLLERFNGDLTLALAAYNAGPKAVEKYGYIPPITETKQYVKKVLSHYNGKTVYPVNGSYAGKNEKKSEPIYKIVLEDGTILFTNSSLFGKNLVRY
jgi:hypothetical protein